MTPGRPETYPRSLWLLLCALQAALAFAASQLAYHRAHTHSGMASIALLVAVPVLLALWVAARRGSRVGRSFLLGIAVFVVLGSLAARRGAYRPEGDEPWYLVQSDSIAWDRDLIVPPEEVVARSPWHYGASLGTDQITRYQGIPRVPHWPALSVLLLPASLARSVVLARLCIAALVALGVALGSRAFGRLWSDERAGLLSAALLVATSPLGQYGLMLFPDGVAAAIWMIALHFALEARTLRSGLGAGLIAGGLVWLKPSFGILAIGCAAVKLVADDVEARNKVPTSAGIVAGIALQTTAFVGFQLASWGQVGNHAYSIHPEHALPELGRSLFEPGRGLAVHYPLWLGVLVLAVIPVLVMPRLRSAVGAVTLVGGTLGSMLLPGMFAPGDPGDACGGWAPPGRYWTAFLPALVAALALEKERVRPWLAAAWKLGWVRGALVACALVGTATNGVHLLLSRLAFSDGAHWISRALGR